MECGSLDAAFTDIAKAMSVKAASSRSTPNLTVILTVRIEPYSENPGIRMIEYLL
jgi:hypothetical protein